MTAAIVTGGGGGIGAVIAEALAGAGHAVYVLDRSAETAAAVAEGIARDGGQAEPVTADISDAVALAAVCARADAEHGPLGVLVNCAALSGIEVLADVLEETPDAFRRVIDVNLTGTFLASQAAARVMARHGRGCIVNISSVAGLGAQERAASYCASKAGVIGLTQAMAIDLAPLGVRVCAIAPGAIDTAKSQAVIAEEPPLRLPKATPLGTGTAADVAAAVVFLTGESGRFVTGATLVVDGGLMAY